MIKEIINLIFMMNKIDSETKIQIQITRKIKRKIIEKVNAVTAAFYMTSVIKNRLNQYLI